MSKAPYRHSDGSDCYTKNCSLGHYTSTDAAIAKGDINAFLDAKEADKKPLDIADIPELSPTLSSSPKILSETFDTKILEEYSNALSKHGGRSAKKLEPVHGFLAQSLADNLSDEFVVTSKGYGENKEKKVAGAFNGKDCDVTISDKNGKDLSVIAVKLPTGNFKQNANNYFENMLGETANLKLADVKVAHAIFLPHKMPYYNDKGILVRIEVINDKDIDKYRKLLAQKSIVKPNNLFLTVLEYGMEDSYRIGMHKSEVVTSKKPSIFDQNKLATNFSPENSKFINKHSNYKAFINKIVGKL